MKDREMRKVEPPGFSSGSVDFAAQAEIGLDLGMICFRHMSLPGTSQYPLSLAGRNQAE